jgi:type I restriction enzyme S subunit
VKRYPKYKESGQSWVGQVPAHWELKPNRSLFRDVGQTVENKGEGVLLLSLTQNGLIPRDMENPTGKFPADFSTYQKVKTGDLVFCLFDVDETPRTVGISSHEGMITGAYTVVRCYDESHAKYLYWFYLSLDEAKRLKPLYKGLRKVVPAETFRSIKSPIPPRDEAVKICNFIESQVDSMNKAISSQERMIELLKERRSAIITHAVTKGLKPKAKMKDTGVPWLGHVPAHWNIMKLSRIIDPLRPITYGIVQAGEDFLDGVKYIRPVDMTDSAGVKDEASLRTTTPEIALQYKRSAVKSGDVVFSIGPSYGKVMIVPASLQGANLTQGTARLALVRDASRNFMCYALQSAPCRAQWDVSVGGATFAGLNLKPLSRTLLAIPPLNEQEEISAYLDRIINVCDHAIASQEKMIELLKERRSAVVTQAVTGQIDVR